MYFSKGIHAYSSSETEYATRSTASWGSHPVFAIPVAEVLIKIRKKLIWIIPAVFGNYPDNIFFLFGFKLLIGDARFVFGFWLSTTRFH